MYTQLTRKNSYDDTLVLGEYREHLQKLTMFFSRSKDVFGKRLTVRLPLQENMPEELFKDKIKELHLLDKDSRSIFSMKPEYFKELATQEYENPTNENNEITIPFAAIDIVEKH